MQYHHCYKNRSIVGNSSKCCRKVLDTRECRAKYSSKWLKWNTHDSLLLWVSCFRTDIHQVAWIILSHQLLCNADDRSGGIWYDTRNITSRGPYLFCRTSTELLVNFEFRLVTESAAGFEPVTFIIFVKTTTQDWYILTLVSNHSFLRICWSITKLSRLFGLILIKKLLRSWLLA